MERIKFVYYGESEVLLQLFPEEVIEGKVDKFDKRLEIETSDNRFIVLRGYTDRLLDYLLETAFVVPI